jgi:hypothetical protein
MVKKCCYVCRHYGIWDLCPIDGRFICHHEKVKDERKIIYNPYKQPDWCPGFILDKRLEDGRNAEVLRKKFLTIQAMLALCYDCLEEIKGER